MSWFNDLLNLDPDWRKRSRPAMDVPIPANRKLPAPGGAQIAQPSRKRPRPATTSKPRKRR
jgi:hypothetical protein